MPPLPADHWSRTPPPVGSWVCFTHGPVEPDRSGIVESCPLPGCREIAYKVVADRKLGHNYAPAKPAACSQGHPYTPGRISLGHLHCRAHRFHSTWRCWCGDLMAWPRLEPGCSQEQFVPPAPRS